MVGPASIPGMDFSDYSSFIKNGYPAIMITDTGFYRNKFYHTEHDNYDTINFNFMADNINNTYLTVKEILNMDSLLDQKDL